MAEKLTFEQQQAVENRGGKLLVSAAAGSGKTKVLVDRLMGYILTPSQPANIDDFLIITYTKAAAAELRVKIAAKLSELIAVNPGNRHLQQQLQRIYLAKISTVHGFCSDVLRQYAYRLDISSDFRVGDETECLQLQAAALEQVMNEAYENADKNSDFYAFVDSQGMGRDDRQAGEVVLKTFHSARCHLDPDGWLAWCASQLDESISDAGQTPWGRYLMDDMRQYLAWQMDAINRCVTAASACEGMEKAAALFASTATQLQRLHDSKTWDEMVENGEIDFGRLTFPKNCSDLQLAEQLKSVRNACKDGLAKRLRAFTDKSEQILEDMALSNSAARGLVELVRSFRVCYDSLKRRRGILDFGDLEHKTLDLFLGKQRSSVTAVAAEVGACFREIMVDEYQDSNGIQDAIFGALTQKRQNCFMVGDVKQSIYQFRLADPSIFIEKYNTYKPVDAVSAGEGRRVLLSNNFRSSSGVIEAVNDVFSRCMSPAVGGLAYGENEMLREGIPHIPLTDPEVSLFGIDVQSDTYGEEASFVAEQIFALLDGTHTVRDGDALRPIRPEDIVILLRSPGSVGGEFQYALRARGIRCAVGDTTDLLQTEEVLTLRAILQIIDNPLQDIPLAAVLTSPVFGFTAEDLARLRCSGRSGSIYSLLCSCEDEKAVRFLSVLTKLRTRARFLRVAELLGDVYAETDLLSTYGAMDDGESRIANLQSFFQIVSDYETQGTGELSRLLEFLDAADARGLGGNAQQDSGAVTIMSIHKSKGLEFPVVFLCGLSRKFNRESAYEQVLCDKDLGLGLACVDARLRARYPSVAKRAIAAKIMRESVSEEMRVLYVAMTRARDRLIMTYAEKNLAGTLQELAMRLPMSSSELLAAEADCPGVWVLQTALCRTEAGELFALGGNPCCGQMREKPWLVRVVTGTTGVENCLENEENIPENAVSHDAMNLLSANLRFTYEHIPATQIPSKLTATQLKGRMLDMEIADGTMKRFCADIRKPGNRPAVLGKAYGNAIHAVMQYIRFEACGTIEGIQKEIECMVREKLISPEQGEMADCEKILTFFGSDIGKRLQAGGEILREFKFSILDSADKYYRDAEQEQILLQGVVDCGIIDADGIIVLDFKTDYVTEETLPSVAEKYRPQVQMYAEALSRIYQMPVKSAQLYFFSCNQFFEIM